LQLIALLAVADMVLQTYALGKLLIGLGATPASGFNRTQSALSVHPATISPELCD
jgi:hypothetical protein